MGLCESWEPARRVLRDRFPQAPLHGDVAHFAPDRECELLTAGFPCTDLSHAGGKAGIFGPASGLVVHVFRIAGLSQPEWIVLENVPNLLSLHSGAGMAHLTEQLDGLGYRWAYRTVDARTTGLPQRRPRVLLLASLHHDPAAILLADPGRTTSETVCADPASKPGDVEESADPRAWGFYWTEGRNGLGLVADAIPTLKGGSTLGLPSAPAIWIPEAPQGRRFVLPSVQDGEALQGLPRGWTTAAVVPGELDLRWKLIGNAVPTGIGAWIGHRLRTRAHTTVETPRRHGGEEQPPADQAIDRTRRWPPAGRGDLTGAWRSEAGPWPSGTDHTALHDLVEVDAARPLSHRAVTGFLKRLDESGRTVPADFYRDLEAHQAATRPPMAAKKGSWASSDRTRRRMQSQAQWDTKPELVLRRALRNLGLGYRLQYRPDPSLRTRMDIVFPGAKVAIDVRGCFWHSCPRHGTRPRVNAERWAAKLAGNVERDDANVAALERLGWEVVVVWEHDDHAHRARHIASRVRARRSTRSGRRSKGVALTAGGR